MKTQLPKGLNGADLRGLLDGLGLTPSTAAKFLKVTERSVWRWLADDSAPRAVLAWLWFESAEGREAVAMDVGNELVIYRSLASGRAETLAAETARLAYLVRLGDFGAANDPLISGPWSTAMLDMVINPAVGLVGGFGGVGGALVQRGEVGPDGGIHPPGAAHG